MGLLSKINPHATASSVVCHALGWGTALTVLYAALPWLRPSVAEYPFPPAPLFFRLVLVFALGAFVGGVIEWQVNDADDEVDEG